MTADEIEFVCSSMSRDTLAEIQRETLTSDFNLAIPKAHLVASRFVIMQLALIQRGALLLLDRPVS